MDIQAKFTLASLTISLSEQEANAALTDPRALQASIRAALHPELRAARNGRTRNEHAQARKAAVRRPKAKATLICTTCGKIFKQKGRFDRHVIKHTAEPVAAS